MSKIEEKLAELKGKINTLNQLANEVDSPQDVANYFNEAWPKIKDVLEFVKDMKLTGKRADKKLQAVITAGDNVYATTSDPAKFEANIEKLDNLLDEIDDKIDRVISILTFIEKIFKEDSGLDNLLEKTIEFLTKASKVINDLGDKLEAN